MSKVKENTLSKLLKSKVEPHVAPYSYKVNNSIYLILTEKESIDFAQEIIFEVLFTLSPDIIDFYSVLEIKTIQFIQKMYEEELANYQILNTLFKPKELANQIIKSQGLSKILSCDMKELTSGRYKIYKSRNINNVPIL